MVTTDAVMEVTLEMCVQAMYRLRCYAQLDRSTNYLSPLEYLCSAYFCPEACTFFSFVQSVSRVTLGHLLLPHVLNNLRFRVAVIVSTPL